jgi:hypothetical protein
MQIAPEITPFKYERPIWSSGGIFSVNKRGNVNAPAVNASVISPGAAVTCRDSPSSSKVFTKFAPANWQTTDFNYENVIVTCPVMQSPLLRVCNYSECREGGGGRRNRGWLSRACSVQCLNKVKSRSRS